jgi:hypothetical protein
MTTKQIHYEHLSKVTKEDLEGVTDISVTLDSVENSQNILTMLSIDKEHGGFIRMEKYDSLIEISTIATKELLLLFAKRKIIASDPEYYIKDDPKLHSYLSKLDYFSIKTVAENVEEFSTQFKAGHVTMSLGYSANKKPHKKSYR